MPDSKINRRIKSTVHIRELIDLPFEYSKTIVFLFSLPRIWHHHLTRLSAVVFAPSHVRSLSTVSCWTILLSKFLLEICWEEIAEEIYFFRISFWCLTWDTNPNFTANKATHYLLDYGDLFQKYDKCMPKEIESIR